MNAYRRKQKSHLLQMRGLKRYAPGFAARPLVASFTDAWIETSCNCAKTPAFPVASFTDAWIETFGHTHTKDADKSHLLQMRGLKPLFHLLMLLVRLSHLLQMRGLKPDPPGAI